MLITSAVAILFSCSGSTRFSEIKFRLRELCFLFHFETRSSEPGRLLLWTIQAGEGYGPRHGGLLARFPRSRSPKVKDPHSRYGPTIWKVPLDLRIDLGGPRLARIRRTPLPVAHGWNNLKL